MSYHIEQRGRASRRPRVQPMGDDGAFLLSMPPMIPIIHGSLGMDAKEVTELVTAVPITPFLLGDAASAPGLTDEQKAALKALFGLLTVIALAWFAMSAFKKKRAAALPGSLEMNATHGYAHVEGLTATIYGPHGGKHVGRVTKNVPIPRGTGSGWYKVSYSAWGERLTVKLGKKIDPDAEADRLEGNAERMRGGARTGSPGIAGYQERAEASSMAVAAKRQIAERFAILLRSRGK